MPESPGPNCPFGGHRIDVGFDANGTGTLEANEINAMSYVCNGAESPLIQVTEVQIGSADCEHGGQRITVGFDRNDSGGLDPEEIQSTVVVCQPAPVSSGGCSTGGSRPGAWLTLIVLVAIGRRSRYASR